MSNLASPPYLTITSSVCINLIYFHSLQSLPNLVQMWKDLRHISKEPLFQTKALGSKVSFCVRLSVCRRRAIKYVGNLTNVLSIWVNKKTRICHFPLLQSSVRPVPIQVILLLVYCGNGRENFASNVTLYPCKRSRQNNLDRPIFHIVTATSWLEYNGQRIQNKKKQCKCGKFWWEGTIRLLKIWSISVTFFYEYNVIKFENPPLHSSSWCVLDVLPLSLGWEKYTLIAGQLCFQGPITVSVSIWSLNELLNSTLSFYTDFVNFPTTWRSKFTLKVMTHDMQTSQCKHLLVPAVWPVFVCMSSVLGLTSMRNSFSKWSRELNECEKHFTLSYVCFWTLLDVGAAYFASPSPYPIL